jgi:aminopeptidase
LQHAALIRHGRLEDIELSHAELQAWYATIVRHGAAYICLQGPEYPHLPAELARTHPERYAVYRRGCSAASSGFQRYGLEGQTCPWVVAPCAARGWGQVVFPDSPAPEALDQLAERIFQITFADQEQAFELAATRDRQLKARCRQLDKLGITEVLVHGGGSHLRVGLSPKARWRGGAQKTSAGQTFYSNMPSVEISTTPDQRLTEGCLAATRPFRLRGGPVVKDLVLRFEGGQVVGFDASCGQEVFGRWLETNAGARRLGEFALVSEDSCIARCGLFFDLALLDENASSHVALGFGYTRALSGGESKSPRELEELGCNLSAVHMDIMFGSKEVTIVATRSREGEVLLLDQGCWPERFVND